MDTVDLGETQQPRMHSISSLHEPSNVDADSQTGSHVLGIDSDDESLHKSRATLRRRGEEVVFSDIDFYIPQAAAPTSSNMFDAAKRLMKKITETRDSSADETTADLEAQPEKFKRALCGVSGVARSGEVLAIMGPSGGGKTTLLHAFAGRAVHGITNGTILFGGQPRDKDTRRKIGYVMQDDVFFANLTVRDTLAFTSKIRIPESVSTEERERRVNDVIQKLGLTRCQNTQIGNQTAKERISGGERKRVNIANELLSDPPILLLDEPTSGLDSNTALTVVRLLKEIALEGKTVITTIHQPSSQAFAEFDKLLLLAEGSVVYFGEASKAVDYFASIGFPCPYGYNPADFFLELLTQEDLNGGEPIKATLKEAWKQHEQRILPEDYEDSDLRQRRTIRDTLSRGAEKIQRAIGSVARASHKMSKEGTVIESASPEYTPDQVQQEIADGKRRRFFGPSKYPVSWGKQFLYLSERAFKQKRGDYFQPLLITQYAILTFLVSIVWARMEHNEATIQNRFGMLFFASVFWSFSTTQTALFTLPTERTVIAKDRASGSYAMSAYFLAKTTVETPIEMVYPLVFSIIVYWVTALNSDFGRFVLFVLTLETTVLAAQSIGYFVSSLVLNVKKGQVIVVCWILGSMLVGGYYVNSADIPVWVSWLKWISFVQYSFSALAVNEYSGQTYPCVPGQATSYSDGGTVCPVPGDTVLQQRGVNSALGFMFYYFMLVAFFIVFRFLSYVGLRFFHTTHKAKV